MRQVWSLTKLVVRESVRKRLVILLGIASLVIVLGSIMVPATDPQGKVTIAESWLFSCISFFGLVIVLFLAGTSLPRDLRKGRLTTLLTKPVNRTRIILSKFLGFSIVLLIFLAVTGGVGYLVLGGIDYRSPEHLLKTNRLIPADEFRFSLREDVDQSVFHGGTTAGEEGRKDIEIIGSQTTRQLAYWSFRTGRGRGYDEPPELVFQLKGRGARGQFNVRGRIFVELLRRTGDGEKKKGDKQWVQVQRKIFDFRQNRRQRMTLMPDAFFREDGSTIFEAVDRFRVTLALANPAGRVQFSEDSVQLEGPPGSYLVNFCKGLLLTYLLLLTLTGFMMAVTPILSGPLSICVGLLFYGTGSLRGFLEDALGVTRSMIEHRYRNVPVQGHHHTPEMNIPTWMLEYSRFVTDRILEVLPRFELFYPGDALTRAFIQNPALYEGFQQMMLYTALFLVAGMFLIQLRELTS